MSRPYTHSGKFKKVEGAALAPVDPARLYSVKLFEQYADCCHGVAYRLIKNGAVKSVKLGRRRLIPGQSIIDFTTKLVAEASGKAAA
jgi:hypothetical protein